MSETFTITIPDFCLKGMKEEPVTIQVTGKGIVKALPDQVIIPAFIYTQNKRAGIAFEENQSKMKKLLDTVTSLGVPKQNITTASLSINTVYKDNSAKVDYFSVSRSITISQDDMNNISPILDALIDAQIEEIGNIQFVVKDMEERYKETLEKAALDCRKTAETITNAIGAKIVNLKLVTYNYGEYAEVPGAPARAEMSAVSQEYSQMIVPKEMTTTVNVYTTYIIEYISK